MIWLVAQISRYLVLYNLTYSQVKNLVITRTYLGGPTRPNGTWPPEES